LRNQGYHVDIVSGKGYDLKISVNGKEFYIEVKARKMIGDVDLEGKEYKKALNERKHYILAIVTNVPNNPEAYFIRDPINYVKGVKIDKYMIILRGSRDIKSLLLDP